MNIHVARTTHFCTDFTHTCCQGQTGSLTVRPDTARWTQTVTTTQQKRDVNPTSIQCCIKVSDAGLT